MIINGEKILDQEQNVLHAHGGQIVYHNSRYYWIGEDRRERNKVSCYSSNNLINWEFENCILSLDSPTSEYYVRTDSTLEISGQKADIGEGCNIERPKVIYNEKTKQWIMWMHWERPSDYSEARCAIAVSDDITKEFRYLGSFNPVGHMSRDNTLYKDVDGTAYFISSARDNADMNIYRLSDDYLSIDEHVRTLWPGQFREAPAVFKSGDYYYMLTSDCTGWSPNQTKYAYSKSITGKWSPLINIGNEDSYRSQPTWVLPIKNSGKQSFLYIGDRWEGENDKYYDSTYVFLPLELEGNTLSLNWSNEFKGL